MLFVCRRQMSLCCGFDRVRQEARPHEYDRRGNQDGNKQFDEGPECTTFIASCHDLGVTWLIRHIFEGAMQFFFFFLPSGRTKSHTGMLVYKHLLLSHMTKTVTLVLSRSPRVAGPSSSLVSSLKVHYASKLTDSPAGKLRNSPQPRYFCGLSVGK